MDLTGPPHCPDHWSRFKDNASYSEVQGPAIPEKSQIPRGASALCPWELPAVALAMPSDSGCNARSPTCDQRAGRLEGAEAQEFTCTAHTRWPCSLVSFLGGEPWMPHCSPGGLCARQVLLCILCKEAKVTGRALPQVL